MTGRKMYLAVFVIIAWFALIAQIVLHVRNSPVTGAETYLRLFTYFTITTNILIAVYMTVHLFTAQQRQKGFWFNASVQTAFALYITVVGLVFNIILRHLWTFEGLQAVLHELLHTVTPLMTIIYWWRWVNAKPVRLANIPLWLLYPGLYAIIIVVRGGSAQWYPYPFMDVATLGAQRVLINSGFVLLTFLVLAFFFVLGGQKKPAYAGQV